MERVSRAYHEVYTDGDDSGPAGEDLAHVPRARRFHSS